MRPRDLALAFAIVAGSTPGAAQSPRAPRISVTEHTGQFNGETVRYTATVAETFLRDSAGRAEASVVTFAYVRTDVIDRASRPVMFAFNGGPGASSTPLHLAAFGPRRRTSDDSNPVMLENPSSPLDAVDLVFIDPVGTGFSRPFPGVSGKKFWSRTGDALSVRAVIKDWIRKNGRERSPKYLLGQSYGTTRAALILKHHGDLVFDGVLLFALVAEPAGLEMPFVASFPSFATTAWYHGRSANRDRTVEQVYEEAVEFARTDYVTALIRGSGLPAPERQRLAERMSAMIGLSPELILANDLRVPVDTFIFDLLKDHGLRTGMLDGRATARLDAPARKPPYNDPGLNYRPPTPGDSSATARGPEARGVFTATGPDAYFKTVLGFRTNVTYNPLNLDVNRAWDYEGMTDVNPEIGAAMRADPKLRALWAAGYYDISTPAYAARYALDHAGIPADRLTAVFFPAGHSAFTEDANLAILAKAVRDFVRPH